MLLLIFHFISVHSFVTSITAGVGLNGGTITDFGTISLSNISNVSENWLNPNQISVNNFGQVTGITNITTPNGNFTTPRSIIIDQGRISSITSGPRCRRSNVTTFITNTSSFVFTSTTPTTLLNFSWPGTGGSLNTQSRVIFNGLISVTGGSVTVDMLGRSVTYTSISNHPVIFMNALTQSPFFVPVTVSVTSGASATFIGPYTFSIVMVSQS